jgi:hypothetical protein
MARDKLKVIDEFISTLFVNDARGYQGVDAKVMQDEGKRAVLKQISLLDETKHPGIRDKKLYALQKLDDFHKLSQDEKEHIVRISQQRSIPVAEAYDPRDASRN